MDEMRCGKQCSCCTPRMRCALLYAGTLQPRPCLSVVYVQTLAGMVGEEELAVGLVYPPLDTIGSVSIRIAVQVANFLFDAGEAGEVGRMGGCCGVCAVVKWDTLLVVVVCVQW